MVILALETGVVSRFTELDREKALLPPVTLLRLPEKREIGREVGGREGRGR